jgi:hypothetical protein
MLTTRDLIAQLRAIHGNVTNYRVAHLLQINQATMNGYIHHDRSMTPLFGLRAAAQLGLNSEYVLACLAVERERDPDVRAVLVRAAERAAKLKPPKTRLVPTHILGPPGRRGRPPYQGRLILAANVPAPSTRTTPPTPGAGA